MNKYKITMVISSLVAVMLIIYMIVPVLSMADKEKLNMQLTKVQINGGYQINVTGSSPSKIQALSYVKEKKTIADFNNNAEAIIAYFEGDKATKLNIKNDNYIDEVINVNNFGSYTVYLRNIDGEIQLSYITINDKNAINLEVISQENNDSKSLLIKASSTANLTAVKVSKTNNALSPANFINVNNLLNGEVATTQIEYPIIEDGTYQIYVEDVNKTKKIQSINIMGKESKSEEDIQENKGEKTEDIQPIDIGKISEETKKEEIKKEETKKEESFEIPIVPTKLQDIIQPIDIGEFTKETESTQIEETVNKVEENKEEKKETNIENVNTQSEEIVIEQPISKEVSIQNENNVQSENYEQIPDKTGTSTETVKIQSNEENVLAKTNYPQTGSNDYIVIIGIIVSTVVAIVSFIKMKQA